MGSRLNQLMDVSAAFMERCSFRDVDFDTPEPEVRELFDEFCASIELAGLDRETVWGYVCDGFGFERP